LCACVRTNNWSKQHGNHDPKQSSLDEC
jgi:hypothetical protein